MIIERILILVMNMDSIWSKNEIPKFPPLQGDLKTDVLIVGGGMAGLLCAWELNRQGVDYALVEADRICRGVTRNTTAKITTQHGKQYSRLARQFGTEIARGYWEANQAALERMVHLGKALDCGLEQKDSYLYTLEPGALDEEMTALDALGISAEYVEEATLPFLVSGAIRIQNQAQFDPLRFAAEIAKGLRIYEHTPAREFAEKRVLTDSGQITAEKVIIATHFPILNKHGGYFLKLYQDRSYVIALENTGGLDGMYRDQAAGGLSFREARGKLLLGGGSHRTGKPGHGWTGLENQAKVFYPGARIVTRWATQDCMSLDGIPYIGQYSPNTPGLFVATGFNKWGMTASMVSAMVLSNLVQGKEDPWAEVFSPKRSIWRKQLFLNAGESALHLLRPTAPRCPHLGCALRWNPQERSWDCPCHGSRFNGDGKLLDNPATGDLRGGQRRKD